MLLHYLINPLTVLQKNPKWTCVLDVGILTKMLWLQSTIAQNSLVSHANYICTHFECCLDPLEKEKLLQVHLLFLKILAEKCKDEELSQLIDLGTCGLHTAHNAFKHGEKASDWQLKKLMSSMSKIFHEALGRCTNYKIVTDATENDYPMQFIAHRWVENDVVAKKARMIWSKIIEVVSYWQQLPKNKQPGLGKPAANTSYDHLCMAVKD